MLSILGESNYSETYFDYMKMPWNIVYSRYKKLVSKDNNNGNQINLGNYRG